MGKQQRKIRVIGERRSKPDIKRLSRALIELAQAQAEAEATAEHQHSRRKPKPRSRDTA